jgi:hypothetical protein
MGLRHPRAVAGDQPVDFDDVRGRSDERDEKLNLSNVSHHEPP